MVKIPMSKLIDIRKHEGKIMSATQQYQIETTLNEDNLTWHQRLLFHQLVNNGMLELNAYTACLSVC